MKKSTLLALNFITLHSFAFADSSNQAQGKSYELVINMPAKAANNLTIVNQCNNSTRMQATNVSEKKSKDNYSYSYSSVMSSSLGNINSQSQKDSKNCTVTLKFNEPCKDKDSKNCVKTIEFDPNNEDANTGKK